MTKMTQSEWLRLNDEHVRASVAWIRALMAEKVTLLAPSTAPRPRSKLSLWERWFGSTEIEESHRPQVPSCSELTSDQAKQNLDAALSQLTEAQTLPALGLLAKKFELTVFEEQILQLCLAYELDTRVGWMCGQIQDKPHRAVPTFGLAMMLFSEPNWAAITYSGSLRQWRLVDIRQSPETPFVSAELQLPESVLHYLRGVSILDPLLAGYLTHSNSLQLNQLNRSVDLPLIGLAKAIEAARGSISLVQLIGNQDETSRAANDVSRMFQRPLYAVDLDFLPQSIEELASFTTRWNRDCRLLPMAILVTASSSRDSVGEARLQRFLKQIETGTTLVFVSTEEKIELLGIHSLVFEVVTPKPVEQRALWLQLLPVDLADRQQIAGELSRQFVMQEDVAKRLVTLAEETVGTDDTTSFSDLIRSHCNALARPKLQGLAQRIEQKSTWDDLVLGDEPASMLRQIVDQVRFRYRVYDEWGVANRLNRGLGISALFAGESGTGKTMAAEIIAGELGLDLYRVDLSAVVNKYIGETEKHLRRLFDEFESCGAILLFDECDALFGKRSEVKDSHDRYANIEINYLLQRLETYRGVAILATNSRSAMDTAFLRRLRFIVNFANPEAHERRTIWTRQLGVHAQDHSGLNIPLGNLDFDRLAQFPLSGGNIQSIVMNAAFRAASRATEPVLRMQDLLKAIRDEYIKLDRPVNESQFRWIEPESRGLPESLCSREPVIA